MKALDKNDELTPLGGILARMPVEPRLGKMIIYGCIFFLGDAVTIIAACTSLGEPFVIPIERRRLNGLQRALAGDRHSDHVAMLTAFQQWEGACRRGPEAESQFCDFKSLSLPLLRNASEAAKQMKQILINADFPEDCFTPQRLKNRGCDPQVDTLLTLLTLGLYPNICYHKEKRRVLTTDAKAALVHKSSVNCSNFDTQFPFPFFIFGEKVSEDAMHCTLRVFLEWN